MAVTTHYFCTESGKSQVRDFIDSLDSSSQRKFFRTRLFLRMVSLKRRKSYLRDKKSWLLSGERHFYKVNNKRKVQNAIRTS